MIRPVPGPVGQGYGANPTRHNPHPVFGDYQRDGHAGQDYPVGSGTPIRAVTSGVVLHVGYYSGSYRDNSYWIAPNFAGWCYVVKHDATAFTRAFFGIYAHGMHNGARVKVWDRVAEGQVLGLSGNTGGSTGDHLHFEILFEGFNLNGPMYGRSNPELLFKNTITAQGATITQEDDMSAADVEALQKINNSNTDRAILDARAQIKALGEELAKKIADSTYQIKLWDQQTDNATGDRVINALRADIGAMSPTTIAELIPAEIAQAVADELAKRLVK